MTLEEIKAIAETWFDWPEEKREQVTYTSCLLFAREMYERGQAEREKYQELIAAAEAVTEGAERHGSVGYADRQLVYLQAVIEKVKNEN